MTVILVKSYTGIVQHRRPSSGTTAIGIIRVRTTMVTRLYDRVDFFFVKRVSPYRVSHRLLKQISEKKKINKYFRVYLDGGRRRRFRGGC